MDLTVYKSNFEKLGVIDDITSLIWHRKYYTSGLFKLKVPFSEHNKELIEKKYMIHKQGSDEAGIIDEYYYKHEEDGSEYIEVGGYFLTGILTRRIIPRQTTFYDTYRNIMHSLVNTNCVNTEAKRVIPYLQLPALAADTAEKARLQVTGKNLLTYLGKLSLVSEIGFKILFLRDHMEFTTYKGLDKSKNQTENPRVYFAQEYDNLATVEYTYSETSKVTAAYVAGEGEGTARTIIEVDNGETGLDRYETWTDARAGREEGMTDAQYLEMLNQSGLEVIKPAAENFAGTVTENYTTIYKQDFDIGDIVTIFSKKWNKEMDARITEVEEVTESNTNKIVVYFGTTEPTLADILQEDK